tara:strand:+ start:4741 stop:4899 length:159 start_codon:yes stop_codon:yes gene_type:complete
MNDVITLIWNNGKCKVYNFDDIIYQFDNQNKLVLNLKKKLKVLDPNYKWKLK